MVATEEARVAPYEGGRESSPALPRGWSWVTVERLAAAEARSLTDGPFGSNLKTSHYTDAGPRVIRLQNVGDGVFVDEHAHISWEHFRALEKHRIEAGDIVIASLGDRPPRACVVPPSVGVAIVKADCIRFKPEPDLAIPTFLNYMLNAEPTRDRMASVVHGVGRPRLGLGTIKRIPLPVPPLAEQRRIVAEIEKQFSRLEAGVAALKRAHANLKRYRAAVLQAACEGRLVPTEAELARAEGRGYETGERLLSRILNERRESWPGRCREPVLPREIAAAELPAGWQWVTVDCLLRSPMSNGISLKGTNEPPGVPSLKLSAMSDRGFLYDAVKYVPLQVEAAKDVFIRQGDFFVSRGNGSIHLVGRGTLAQAPPGPVIFPDLMIRLRLTPTACSTRWLPTIWAARRVRRQIERRAKTTAGIWKVSQPDLMSIVVPLPPLAEQTRIVAEVERRLSVVEELEAAVEANLKRADRLRQSILKGAFEGKLVPQDPNDEPASALLERIRAEREAADEQRPRGAAPPGRRDGVQRALELE